MTSSPQKCSDCGEMAVVETVGRVTHKIRQREVTIDGERHLRCGGCGVISYRGDMLDESQHAIAARVRREDHLLSPDELRVIRLKYRLTQAEMEKVLTIGPKTWIRWERGKVVQCSAADQIIRQIAKNPEVLRDLMNTNAVRSEAAEAVLASMDLEIERRIANRLKENFPETPMEILLKVSHSAAMEIRAAVHSEIPGERSVA